MLDGKCDPVVSSSTWGMTIDIDSSTNLTSEINILSLVLVLISFDFHAFHSSMKVPLAFRFLILMSFVPNNCQRCYINMYMNLPLEVRFHQGYYYIIGYYLLSLLSLLLSCPSLL